MIRIFSSQKRKVSAITLFAILLQLFYPVGAFALTGGPSQAEFESFEPAGATEMVNLATGDFIYNIPLMDVDGYPLNISYHGGVNMEQEASWVGLGWSLNPGAINRGMRGLPDDFNGGSDIISENIHIKENKTYGLNVGGGVEVAGFDFASLGLNMGFGIQYNTYKGLGLEVELGVSGALTASQMGDNCSASGTASGGLGIKISNQDGADFTMSGGLGTQMGASYGGIGVSGSLGINRSKTNNSRRGIEADIVSGSASAGVSVMGVGFATGTGSSINLIPNTAYSPNIQFPTTFSGITGEIHGGGELYWVNIHGYTRAYIFKQGLDGSSFSREGYGYLNLENSNFNALTDFNRDNDGVYYLECPKLPFANLTYDLFNANAQGLNELFRPYRNDVGFVHDNIVSSGGSATDIGLEGNYGQLFELGFNDYSTSTNSTSGPWIAGNNAWGQGVRFKGDNQLTNNGTNTYEHAYFKAIDEMPIEDQSFYNSILGKDLSSFQLSPAYGTNMAILQNNIRNSSGGSSLYTGQKKSNREPRNTNFSFLNVTEAKQYGLEKIITSYKSNTFDYSLEGDIAKVGTHYSDVFRDFNSAAANHHISEITVLKDDGARYIYGIPVYNKSQKEVVFNVEGQSNNSSSGVTEYNPGSDNSSSNGRGIDEFFLSKNVSPYAHSYLLTGLLSKDYVDLSGDGITSDDYGDYTKFNYSRVSNNYKWRTPCTDYTSSSTKREALYDPQWRSDSRDDKGIYMYGEKEVWYPHSIETKNYVAEFYTSPRDDGKGVSDEGGRADASGASNLSYKLDKIVLYSKKDRNTPIKTVNFSYKYTLCPGTPNSVASAANPTRGKLTLDKIYFTYGKSDKGIFSPYEFTYCDFNHDGAMDSGLNPAYSRTEMDRWGNYKQKPSGFPMENIDFPYTIQNKTTADNSASVWSLSSILTPAKSRIDAYFESDDYSYIQSQIPGQMLRMVNFSSSKPSSSYVPSVTTSADMYLTNSSFTPKNYMIIDLSGLKEGGLLAANITDAESRLRNIMLPANGKLYFKGFVQLGDGASTQEYVPGYSEFDSGNSGIITSGSTSTSAGTVYKYAYVKLNEVDIDDPKNYAGDNCNPISKAAWQITRLYQPRIAYPGSEPGGSVLSACAGLISALSEVFTFKEKNNRLRKKSYGRFIDPTKSFVRLNVPTKSKFGGGHRVSKIEVIDNWNSMVNNEATTTYGQTYNYTTDDNGQLISSGVASYEPLAGGDEISLRSPVEYSVGRVAAPNDAHFFEYPIGEAFYPASTIIYSKITVKNLDRRDGANNLITSNIGRTEYEFYTSKDFPVYGDYSDLQSYVHTPDPIGDLFSNSIESSVHLSQGSILRLNNMHGKLKSVLTYQEGNNNAISGVRYYYKTTSGGNELDNTVAVISEAGVISSNIIGQHVEALADFRSQNTTTYANTISGNVNVTLVTIGPIIFPLPIPSVFWGNTTDTRDFYSATFNKVVTQQAILERVETVSNYATSTTENLLWDAKTTDVILSRTTTNFKDYNYEYNTPAHWVYQGMGGAFKNVGYGFKNVVTATTGQITLSNGLLTPGDEVALEFTNSSNSMLGMYNDRLWISKDATSGQLVLIDRDGTICNTSGGNNVFASAPSGTSNYVLKVIRSGYRNILDESAEEISYSKDPRTGSSINLSNNILDAGATEYSEDWQKFCSNFNEDGCVNPEKKYCDRNNAYDGLNPYILNMKGNWNEKRVYSFLGNRLAKNGANNMDIRNDGTFDNYKPFFKYFSGSWKEVYNPSRTSDYDPYKPFASWILNSEVTKITPFGNEVEDKDAINRFSSSLFGYNHTLKTAAAANAKYREIGFDNFEDYGYVNCSENHFGFKNSYTNLQYGIAHTGRYSMRVNPGQCVSTTKSVTFPDAETKYGSNNVFIPPPVTPPGDPADPFDPSASVLRSSSSSTTFYPANCIPDFAPESHIIKDQKFILSVWVKESIANKNGDYANIRAEVVLSSVTNIETLVKKSAIINGWQKLDYEFTIPAGTPNTPLRFILRNTGTSVAYFDDIRVQPFNASMGSYVYDPYSLKIWAELDERNFATIYEYDNEGVLVRVKKETEKGINTIQETRNSFKKQ